MNKIDAFIVFVVVSLLLLFSFQVFAQDATPTFEAGKYTVAASFPADADVVKVCAFRTDTKVDLKCVTTGLSQVVSADGRSASVTAPDARKYTVRPPSPTGRVALIQDIDLANTGTDVRIGVRAEDASGNKSVSDNVTVVDFTPPAKPVVISVSPQ